MRETVFVKPRIRYEAYADFWRLVALSPYRIVEAKDADLGSDDIQIWPVMDVEFMTAMTERPKSSRRAKVIFWNLERPDSMVQDGGMVDAYRQGMDEILAMADAAWVSDIGVHLLDERVLFAVLGGHPDLAVLPRNGAGSLVAHFGQRTLRRQAVFQQLRDRGLEVSENSWGPDRDAILARARMLVVMDRVDGIHTASPLRWVVAAAYRLPIVSETMPYPYPLEDGESIALAPYESLADKVAQLKDDPALEGLGEKAWEVFCRDWTFQAGVENALERTASLLG